MVSSIKKILCGILVLFCLSGCIVHVSKNVVRKNTRFKQTDTLIASKYDYLNGTEIYKFDLKEDALIRVDIKTKEGILNLQIENKDGLPEYRGNDLMNASFSVNVKKGSYIVTIEAKKHKGGYKLDWS